MNKTEALPEFLRQRFTGNWLLSDPPQQQKDWLCHAAADEIERLRAENEKLRAELHNANEALTVAYLHGYSTASEQARATAIRETGNE